MWIDWPTEEGFYWYYGPIFRHIEGKSQLFQAHAFMGTNGIVVLLEGAFLWSAEKGMGKFLKMVEPVLPKL